MLRRKGTPARAAETDAQLDAVREYKDGQLYRQWHVQSSVQDIQYRHGKQALGLKQLLLSAFMPEGWPHAVTPDYTGFVAWNTVQAISSYVRGVLSSHAVFKGVGVGSEAATALGAVFQFFVRDILGMAGGIVFAYAAGSNFDSNAKQWRLFADIMNDMAMALDLASPLVPGGFMLLASLGSISRALVGLSAGATGAALTQHFATGSNAADISAKADSRERATSIIGALLGMAVTHHLADNVAAAWMFFLVLTWVHVWANIRALRCLVLSSLNQPRIKLLLQHYLTTRQVLTPQDMSQQESLLVPPVAALMERLHGPFCSITFGAPLSQALESYVGDKQAACRREQQERQRERGISLQELLGGQPAAAARQYILVVTGVRGQALQVVLHQGVGQDVALKAYLHALHLAGSLRKVAQPGVVPLDKLLECVDTSQSWVEQHLQGFLHSLSQQGWQLDALYLPRPEWSAQW